MLQQFKIAMWLREWRRKDITNNKQANVFGNKNNLKIAGDIGRRRHTCQYIRIKFSYLGMGVRVRAWLCEWLAPQRFRASCNSNNNI